MEFGVYSDRITDPALTGVGEEASIAASFSLTSTRETFRGTGPTCAPRACGP